MVVARRRPPLIPENPGPMEVDGVTKARRCRSIGKSSSLFTLERANRALPLVRRIVADIVAQHKKVCELEETCHTLAEEGDGAESRERLRVELEHVRQLAEELSAVGCELKDWRRGIVDFPTSYQGREVEFCWRIGEEKIEYWHELDDGFHARRMIDETFIAEVLQSNASR